MITDLLEALMILCFGLSWPISIRKSWISRTAKGKSLFFEDWLHLRHHPQDHPLCEPCHGHKLDLLPELVLLRPELR